MAQSDARHIQVVAQNRKARFNYTIEDSMEAGVVLSGSEVKSLREGRANISESYARPMAGEIYLINANIPEYRHAHGQNHEPARPRKLLLHRRQINRLIGEVEREGVTLVPLRLYFNERGVAKLQLGVAVGKRKYDKRQAVKQRDWSRQKARLMREKG